LEPREGDITFAPGFEAGEFTFKITVKLEKVNRLTTIKLRDSI